MVLIRGSYLIILILLLFGWTTNPTDYPKKVQRILDAIWTEESVSTQEIQSTVLLEDESAHKIISADAVVGYLIMGKAKSKFDLFDYMLVFDTNGVILQPKILVYREDYGGEIASKRWLKQFIGLDSSSEMKLRHEIQNISGATISCQSAAIGFKQAAERISAIIDEQD